MQRIDIDGVGLVDFPDDMTDDQIVSAINNQILPSIAANQPEMTSQPLTLPGQEPPAPEPGLSESDFAPIDPSVPQARSSVSEFAPERPDTIQGAVGTEIQRQQFPNMMTAAKIKDIIAPGWRERQIEQTLTENNIAAPGPGARIEPSGPKSMLQRIAEKVQGADITPESQAEGTVASVAMRQGMSPQQLKEQVMGGKGGMGERILKGIGSGAMMTADGLLGYAARLTGDMDFMTLQQSVNDQARGMLPADPAFIDQLAAGFGSTATFFIPGLGIMKGAEAVAKVAPTMARWLGAGGAAGMEAAVEAGSVYSQLIQEGKSPEEAARLADNAFWANAGLVSVTNKLGLFADTGGQLRRRTLAAAMEGSQEAGQQGISNLATGRPFTEGMGESAAIGAIVGGGLGGITPTQEDVVRREVEGNVQRADMGSDQVADRQAREALEGGDGFTMPRMQAEMTMQPGGEMKAQADIATLETSKPSEQGEVASVDSTQQRVRSKLESMKPSEIRKLAKNAALPRIPKSTPEELIERLLLTREMVDALKPFNGSTKALSDAIDAGDITVEQIKTWADNVQPKNQQSAAITWMGNLHGIGRWNKGRNFPTFRDDIPKKQYKERPRFNHTLESLRSNFSEEFEGLPDQFIQAGLDIYNANPGIKSGDLTGSLELAARDLKKGKVDKDQMLKMAASYFESKFNLKASVVTPKKPVIKPEQVKSPNYSDARLKRPAYRQWVQTAIEQDFVEKGGIAYTAFDQNDRPTKRSKSVNPPYVQAILAETGMSVKQVKNAVQKAVEGKRLGVNQVRAVQMVLDQVTGERTSPENMAIVRQELERAREIRRKAKMDDTADWVLEEGEYNDDWDGIGRTIMELAEEANTIGGDVAIRKDELLESQRSDEDIAEELAQLISEAKNGRASQSSQEEAAGQQTGRPQASQAQTGETVGDIFGDDTAAAQALEDEKRRKSAKLSGTDRPYVPVEAGDGGLFSGESRQMDIAEIADKPVDKQTDAMLRDYSSASPDNMAPGSNYVPMIEAQYQPDTSSAEPISLKGQKKFTRQEIIDRFLRALGQQLYTGNIRSKFVGGYYYPRQGAIRVKKPNDIEVAAHEIAHYLDDLWWRPESGKHRGKQPWYKGNHPKYETFAKELKSVSYDKGKLWEGFAEFVRLWTTQPESAYASAPEFAAWWEQYLTTVKEGKAVNRFKEDARRWVSQEAALRAWSKMGAEQKLVQIPDRIFDRMRQGIFDNLHIVSVMEKELAGEVQETGIYETARLTRAAYSIVDGALRFGAPVAKSDGSIKFEGKGLEQVLAPVVHEIDEFILYAVGRSARELKGQGRENLFPQEEIEGMLAYENDTFKQVFEDYQTWNRAIVDFAIAKDLITAEQRATWRRKEYLPFYRVNSKGMSRGKKGIEGNNRVVHMLTGGSGNLNDILTNMVQNASNLIVESLKNESRRQIVDFAMKERFGGKYISRIEKGIEVQSVQSEQVRDEFLRALGFSNKQIRSFKAMRESGIVPSENRELFDQINTMLDVMEANMDDYSKFYMFNQAPKAQNLIAIRRNGKTEYYQVGDDMMMAALASFNPKQRNWLVEKMSTVRRIGQGTVTFTFDFMMANLARDTLHGWVFSKNGFKAGTSSLRGMQIRINAAIANRKERKGGVLTDRQKRDAEIYKDFIANGGGMSSYLIDEGALRDNLKQFYQRNGINYSGVINNSKKLWYMMEVLADAFEVSTRLGEFERATKNGAHMRHAAYLAREISTDFAMRGDSVVLGFFFDTVLFLKAATNGLDRVYRGFTKDVNKQQIWFKSGVIATLSVMIYMMNRGLKEYEELEDWDKDNHWHFFIPKGDGSYIHFRYPKIWEIGAMATMAERTTAAAMDLMEGEVDDVDAWGRSMVRLMHNQLKFDYMPQAIEPIYEVYDANRNRFTDRPIRNQRMDGLEPWAQSTIYTSELARDLGEATRNLQPALQISPANAEALIRGYFNTWGYYGLWAYDLASSDKPAPELASMPVLRRFMGKEVPRSKYEAEFWDMWNAATQVYLTTQEVHRQHREDLIEGQQSKPENEDYLMLEGAKRTLDSLRQTARDIYSDREMNRVEKREQINTIKREMNDIYKDVVTSAKAYQRKRDKAQ